MNERAEKTKWEEYSDAMELSRAYKKKADLLKKDLVLITDSKEYKVTEVKGRETIQYREFFDKYFNPKKHEEPKVVVGAVSYRLIKRTVEV